MSGTSEKIRCMYGREVGCDVIFLVGPEEPQWRLPAHSCILKRENHLFRTMLSETYVKDFEFPHTETVNDVDGRAFDNLLRFLYNEPVSLQSVDNALLTLYASHKYRCPNLVRLCVDFLKDKLHESNVLRILRCAELLSCDYRKQEVGEMENPNKENELDDLAPSAPPWNPAVEIEMDQEASQVLLPNNFDNIEAHCWSLLQECLAFVDKFAVTILASDEFEDLDLATIRLILLRDTLDVPNEYIVFDALDKWADKECKRRQLPLTPASKRFVLKDSLFLARFLTMTLPNFQCGPAKSDLFTAQEVQILTKLIKVVNGSQSWAPRLSDFPSLRPYLHEGPRRPLRSIVVVVQPSSSKRKHLRIFKRFKRNKFCCRKNEITTPVSSNHSSPTHRPNPRVVASRRESQSERRSRFNFIENIFICLACLFD